MKISSFITITRPNERGDLFDQCYKAASGFSDEIIVIDGDETWKKEFNWKIIGEHFQKGYEAADGDWVIHLDTDFIFHENDYSAIRSVLSGLENYPAASFYKYQFILPDRYNLKSRLVLAVNKNKYGDRIKFNSGGDLCQPSLDGNYIDPSIVPEAKIPFYNYEKLIKTEEQIKDDVGRMERAFKRHFKKYQLSEDGTDENAYKHWLEMMIGRFNKPSKHVDFHFHPEVIKETILNLTETNWGYSGFGYLEENDYVKSGLCSR